MLTGLPEGEPSSDIADYVIITTQAIVAGSDRLDEFVRHKQERGLSVRVATETDWGGGFGDAAAENMRSYLQAHVAAWGIDYVLLIGNPDPTWGSVPMKVTWPLATDDSSTDYYYADLNTNWDANGNGRAGEWGDDFTTAPDQEVLVGRIPFYDGVTTFAQLDSVLDRTVEYENAIDVTWRENVLLPMAISSYANEDGAGSPRTDNESLAVGMINDILLPNAFDHRLLTEHAGLEPVMRGHGAIANTIATWTDPDDHFGVVAWAAHGSSDAAYRLVWSVDDGDGVPAGAEVTSSAFIRSATTTSLDEMHPSIVIMGSCSNGNPTQEDNLGLMTLLNGAIATYSGTRGMRYRMGDWTVSGTLDDGVLQGFVHHTTKRLVDGFDTETTGGALAWVRENLTNSAEPHYGWKNKLVFNLYGDPSIMLGSQFPGADLIGTRLDVAQDNLLLAGGTAAVEFSVQNRGSEPTVPFAVRFVLSDDHQITATDTPLDLDPSDPAYRPADPTDYHVPTIAAGESFSATVQLQTPVVDPFGTDNDYAIGMLVDAEDHVDEFFEDNNSGRGWREDWDDVYFVEPTTLPFFDDFETGTLGPAWRPVTRDATGRVQVTSEDGPFAGDYHVTMDDALADHVTSMNHLELHVDAGSFEQIAMEFHNREWYDTDQSDDGVFFSPDYGDTWYRLWTLVGDNSTNQYQTSYTRNAIVSGEHPQDLILRFQQLGGLPIPWGGMAFDDIRVNQAKPDLFGSSLIVETPNFSASGGVVQVEFEVSNPIEAISGPFNVRFYLSEDAEIDPLTDVLLEIDPTDSHYDDTPDHAAYRFSSGIWAVEQAADSVRLTVPTSDPFDGSNRYFLGMVVDADEELDDWNRENNRGLGLGLDLAEITYFETASFPFFEDWETGTFRDAWEVIPGVDGRIDVVHEYGPYDGSYHVVMDDAGTDPADSVNQLILHVDLAGQSNVELSYVNREWNDENDPEDHVALSIDGGETWHIVTRLRDHSSSDVNTLRRYQLDDLGLVYSADTWIRFQQRSTGPVPEEGMAFDNIRLGQETEGPRIIDQQPSGRVPLGTTEIELWFNEPMDASSFALSDVVRFVAPDGSDVTAALQSSNWQGDQQLLLTFDALSMYGPYTLVLGPDVNDAKGNPLDQDGDGLNGEPLEDRYVSVVVVSDTLYVANMDTDPGWTLDPGTAPFQWEYGEPTGGGSQTGDPLSGWDGPHVIGYNLAGDYAGTMAWPEYATTPAFDAAGYEQVAVDYYRWLGVDADARDKAVLLVSNDGATWENVWTNPAHPLLDDRYVRETFDLSRDADHEATVWLRWGMGPTDSSLEYYGWNIDNVLVTGIPAGTPLPDVAVTDSQGATDDLWIDFGSVNAVDGTEFHTMTVSNTGSAPLTVNRIAMDTSSSFSMIWDGDGLAPTSLEAGTSRVATVQFDPFVAGVATGWLTVETSDPDAAEQRLRIGLRGEGVEEPVYGWTETFGANGADAALKMVRDPDGSMYLAGFFEGTVDFDPSEAGTQHRTAVGSRDIFVVKLTPERQLGWVWTAGGSQADWPHGLALDAEGNLLVTGEFRTSVDFDVSGDGDLHVAEGYGDLFVTKLGSDGSYQWTYTCGGADSDVGQGVATDSKGNVYVVGDFKGSAEFNPHGTSASRASQGANDVFVLRLSPEGVFDWVNTFGGSAWDLGSSIAVAPDDSVVITGVFFGTVDFDPHAGQDEHTSNGFYDVFLSVLNFDGTLAWTRTWGGVEDDSAGQLAVFSDGAIYVSGSFQGSVDFDPGPATDILDSAGSYDAFVTRWHADGSYGWTHTMGGPGTDFGRGLSVAPGGAVAVTGSFRGTADFDPAGMGDSYDAVGMDDVFVTQLLDDGAYDRTSVFGGTSSDTGYGVLINDVGEVWVAGLFQRSVDFDPSTGLDLHLSHGGQDAFLTKLSEPGVVPAEIHGVKWSDWDADGRWDEHELRLADWTIFLDANDNGVLDHGERSTQTADDGRYAFTGLLPGSYTVAESPREGWLQTAPAAGVHHVTLEAGQQLEDVNFGNCWQPRFELSDRVWMDHDGDGVQDADEPGLADVLVRLFEVGGNLPDTTVTDPAGWYRFSGVTAGDYFLEFVLPEGFYFAAADQGGEDTADSSADPDTGRTPVFQADVGTELPSMHAGMARFPSYGSIGSVVWDDVDGDGIRNSGLFDEREFGLSDITVRLYSEVEELLATTTTDTRGGYRFGDLAPGDYYVEFESPTGYFFSPADQGDDDTSDSDADPVTGRTPTISLSPGENSLSWDTGFTLLEPTAALGNRVWLDANANGVQDVDEIGVPDIPVLLHSTSVGESGWPLLLRLVMTDDEGYFQFSDLTPGDYFLEFDVPAAYRLTMPDWSDDDSRDSDPSWITSRTVTITLEAGEVDDTWDAGLIPAETIVLGDRVWHDANGNGLQDAGERGVAGITVQLYTDPYTMVDSTTTNSLGRYAFVGVNPGDYYVRLQVPGGHFLTDRDVGSDEDRDSDFHPTLGTSDVITLVSGTNRLDLDAGLINEDFGDAPSPLYPTLRSEDGARHTILPGMYLGAGVDAETDGQPHSRALGDDEDGGRDEDGVAFVTSLVPGHDAVIQVLASSEGRLDAWVDFKQDGWTDAMDQVFHRTSVTPGYNTLTFPVPVDAELGVTFARFRFSKNGGLPIGGTGGGGEVEDYEVVVEAVDWGDAPDQREGPLKTRLLSPDIASNQFFGGEVAVSGDLAAVTALGDSTEGHRTGAVYALRWNGAAWITFQKLTLADAVENDRFGTSVAMDGGRMVVGASRKSNAGRAEAGLAYVYQWDGTSWSHEATLTAPAPSSYAHFGSDVAVFGDYVVVGAPGDFVAVEPGVTVQSGAVYVYHVDGSSWAEDATLAPDEGQDGDWFGSRVDIDGNLIVVGAYGTDRAGIEDVGAVYTFRRDSAAWTMTQSLSDPTSEPDMKFGFDVSVSDDRIMVGGHQAAFSYDHTSAGWIHSQTLAYPHLFGGRDVRVDLQGLQCVVGSPNSLAIHLRWDGSQWHEVAAYEPFDDESDGYAWYGETVSVFGDHVLVGAWQTNSLGLSSSGAVYAYEVLPNPSDFPTLKINDGARHNLVPGMFLGAGIDIEPDGQVSLHADGDDLSGTDDEDGVDLCPMIPGVTSCVVVTASMPGYLNAWIDFNQDGDWDDEGEQIFDGKTLVAGPNTLQFQVPLSARPTEQGSPALARFRYGSERDLDYFGYAIDGEVEDYEVTILLDWDADGIPDDVEDAAPGDGDGDGSGIPDRLEGGVASFPDALTGSYVTIVVAEPAILHGVRPVPPMPGGPEGRLFPRGLFEFHVAGIQPGGTADVTMLLHESADYNTYYQVGYRPGIPVTHWYPFVATGNLGAEIQADRAVLHLADGQAGDADVTPDGWVWHVGAPGVNQHISPWQNPYTPVNVDNDAMIAPLDALLIINELNRRGIYEVTSPPALPIVPPPYYDVSGDNLIAPYDALLVINDLHRHGIRSAYGQQMVGDVAEGEAVSIQEAMSPLPVMGLPVETRRGFAERAPYVNSRALPRDDDRSHDDWASRVGWRNEDFQAMSQNSPWAEFADRIWSLDLDDLFDNPWDNWWEPLDLRWTHALNQLN